MKEILLRAIALSVRTTSCTEAHDLYFALCRGEITALTGEQNSGRLALFDFLNGNGAIESGTLSCDGGSESFCRTKIYPASDFSNVAQDITLTEALFLMRQDSLRHLIWRQQQRENQARELLDVVGISRDVHENIGALSSLERFLLNVAIALDMGACLMTIEEDFEGYTASDLQQLAQRLAIIKQQTDLSILLNTNGTRGLDIVADQVLIFRNGCIIKKLRGAQIQPQKVLQYEPYCFPIRQAAPRVQVLDRNRESPIFSMTGWHISSRKFSLQLYAGELLHLVDYNIGRKQQLFQLLSGQVQQSEICLFYRGMPLPANWMLHKERFPIAAIENIGTKGLFEQMTPAENLLFPGLKRISGPLGWLPPKGIERTVVHEWNNSLDESVQSIQQLTQAQAISLQIEAWKVARMRVLLLFEPFLHIDNQGRSALQDALQRFRSDGGSALVLSSSQSGYLGLSTEEASKRYGTPLFDRKIVIRDGDIDEI